MRKKVILLHAILVVAFVATGCGGSTTVKPIYDKSGKPVYVVESDYEKIFTDTDSYKGKFVKLTGKIFTDPEKGDKYMGFQMYTDPEKYEKDIVVYYNENISLKSDDYVELIGYVYGTMDGTNAFGGSVSAPVVIATELKKSDYKNVMAPTLKEKTYTDKTINQSGCILTVTKVEFAEKETRVYVTADNQSGSDFSIYTYSSKIVQGSKQYDQQSNYDADYPELQSDLKNGVKSEGILTFPAVEEGSFKLIMDGSSSNWDIDINEYTFDL